MRGRHEAAEAAKLELSTGPAALPKISLPFITADAAGPKHLEVGLPRATFEALIACGLRADRVWIVC